MSQHISAPMDPSSGDTILKILNYSIVVLIWICFRPQVREQTPTLLGPLEIANLN
jgi:hypothetical protein